MYTCRIRLCLAKELKISITTYTILRYLCEKTKKEELREVLYKEIVGNLDSKYFDVSVADGNPIRLGEGPLHLVDLSLCSIGQNGDLN